MWFLAQWTIVVTLNCGRGIGDCTLLRSDHYCLQLEVRAHTYSYCREVTFFIGPVWVIIIITIFVYWHGGPEYSLTLHSPHWSTLYNADLAQMMHEWWKLCWSVVKCNCFFHRETVEKYIVAPVEMVRAFFSAMISVKSK